MVLETSAMSLKADQLNTSNSHQRSSDKCKSQDSPTNNKLIVGSLLDNSMNDDVSVSSVACMVGNMNIASPSTCSKSLKDEQFEDSHVDYDAITVREHIAAMLAQEAITQCSVDYFDGIQCGRIDGSHRRRVTVWMSTFTEE